MFLAIPLLIILVSLAGILVIILRKKSYLNKLYTLNTAGSGGVIPGADFSWKSYGGEFFPEIGSLLNKLEIHTYKGAWLMELEKFLRKSRMVFLRFDRISDSMIKRIRKIHLNDRLEKHGVKETIIAEEAKPSVETSVPSDIHTKTISPAFLKNEEQRLIMEIAKNPKDATLYESLGDLYLEMDNFTDAKESYEAAVELDSKNEFLGKKLSSALEKMTSH